MPDAIRKLSDGGGFQLWIRPTGVKYWNLAYCIEAKQRKLSIGSYPSTSLKEARERREDARRLLAAGQDPSQQKRVEKATRANNQANTFSASAARCVSLSRAGWPGGLRSMRTSVHAR